MPTVYVQAPPTTTTTPLNITPLANSNRATTPNNKPPLLSDASQEPPTAEMSHRLPPPLDGVARHSAHGFGGRGGFGGRRPRCYG
ncbi:hypothetical protein CP533_0915 [Ophiocordyceps camponoti-saundersi (nom. inval.)]|nr:hypothetical protein CP533_0915 [Ophiocordyceps camponoti-saundersi (nom. inval.)]